MHIPFRYLRTWVVAVGVATVVTAPAIAATRPDDRPGPRGAGASVPTQLAKNLRPDDRPGIHGPGASATVVIHTNNAAFAWRDAAIGGAFALALALGVGVLLVSMRRRGSPTPA
jgi:hypothetical protein